MVLSASISNPKVLISWVDRRFLGLLYAWAVVPGRDRGVHRTSERHQVTTIFLLGIIPTCLISSFSPPSSTRPQPRCLSVPSQYYPAPNSRSSMAPVRFPLPPARPASCCSCFSTCFSFHACSDNLTFYTARACGGSCGAAASG